MRSRLLACLMMFTAYSSASSQPMIAGRLLDKQSKAPLNGVSILLVPDTGSVLIVFARTTSDTNGIFYIQPPALRTYRFIFSQSNASLLSPPLVVKDSDLVQREYLIDLEAERSYFEFQVQTQVQLLSHQPVPKYPESLRQRNIEGEVLAQFIVDANGRAEMWTFKVLRSTHFEFTESVRTAVENMRFSPAEIGGRKVKQLVQMPFNFSLNR